MKMNPRRLTDSGPQFIAIFATLLLPLSGFAQSGSEPSSSTSVSITDQGSAQSQVPSSPITGIPGFLDTEVPAKKSWVIELPSTCVDYGVTDQFSLGANVGYHVLQAVSGTVPFLLKGRYRFLQTKNWTSALTAHLGVMWQKNIVAVPFIINSNTTYYANSNWNFNFHVGTLGLAGFKGDSGTEGANQATLAAVELGVSGTYIIREQTSFQADLLYSPMIHVTADNAAGSASISVSSFDGAPLFAMARLQLLYRSTPTSLWSIGGGAITLGKTVQYFPTLSWTKIL